MRRITVFADEERAKALVTVLENNGYDFMSEDFAEPTIVRRNPPERRATPAPRAEPAPGMLRPTRKPPVQTPVEQKKAGRPASKIRNWIMQILRDQGEDDYDGIMKLAISERLDRKKVRDTLRRMISSGMVRDDDGVYRLEKKDGGVQKG